MDLVYLRALELEDTDRIYVWHNNRSLYESLGGVFRNVSRAAVEEWVRKKQSYSTDEVNLAICVSETKQHIGNIYLRGIDWVNRNAELHIFIGDSDNRSKGYGQAAVREIVRHAFQDLGLVRVYLYVLADNLPAIRTYEKCGFMVEGTLRNHVYKNGQLRNLLVMGVCAEHPTT